MIAYSFNQSFSKSRLPTMRWMRRKKGRRTKSSSVNAVIVPVNSTSRDMVSTCFDAKKPRTAIDRAHIIAMAARLTDVVSDCMESSV